MIADRPAFPKKMLMLPLGLLISVFGGLVLVFVLESFDDSMQTWEEVEAISSIPALATIPLVTGKSLRNGMRNAKLQVGSDGLGVMAAQRPASLLAEAYRVLCNSLLLTTAEHPPKLLVVTSAFPGEGKSVSSCNLAITLAQRGSRVLLVDADLRRSALQSHLGMESNETAGLSSILTGNDVPEAVTKPFSQLPNLAMIPAGPRTPWPTELLASKKMAELLERWSTEYDHVVIDTAPILFFADTMPLAAKADGVLLVVLSGRSRRKALVRMLALLSRAKASVLGVIVNGAVLQPEYAKPYITYGINKSYGDINESKQEKAS